MIISHRGNDKHGFKENTKKAIISTLKNDYVSGVEFDIRMTKDKKIVLSHSPLYKDRIICLTNYKDLHLDLLKNVLNGIKSKKIIIIEIKDYDISIIPVLYKILKNFPNLNIYIHSFHYHILKEWKDKYPSYKIGLIKMGFFNDDKKENILDFLSIYYKNSYSTDKEVFLWTVNSVIKDIQKVNIITDKPYLFKFTTE